MLILFAVVVSASLVYIVWIIFRLRGLSERAEDLISDVEQNDLGKDRLVQRLDYIRKELS